MKQGVSQKRLPTILLGIGIAAIMLLLWFLVRTYIFAMYTVPTGAMEKTIRVGGAVLVNKFNYGPVRRGDILVFHFPEGDTVIDLPEYQSLRPYYEVIRDLGRGNVDSGRSLCYPIQTATRYPFARWPGARPI